MATTISTIAAVKALLQESGGDVAGDDDSVRDGLYATAAFALDWRPADRAKFLELAGAAFDDALAERNAEG